MGLLRSVTAGTSVRPAPVAPTTHHRVPEGRRHHGRRLVGEGRGEGRAVGAVVRDVPRRVQLLEDGHRARRTEPEAGAGHLLERAGVERRWWVADSLRPRGVSLDDVRRRRPRPDHGDVPGLVRRERAHGLGPGLGVGRERPRRKGETQPERRTRRGRRYEALAPHHETQRDGLTPTRGLTPAHVSPDGRTDQIADGAVYEAARLLRPIEAMVQGVRVGDRPEERVARDLEEHGASDRAPVDLQYAEGVEPDRRPLDPRRSR